MGTRTVTVIAAIVTGPRPPVPGGVPQPDGRQRDRPHGAAAGRPAEV